VAAEPRMERRETDAAREGRCEGDASGGRDGKPAEVRANKKNNHEMLAPRREDGNGGRIFSLILSTIEGGLGGA
jgi:hypothetical protein